MPSLLSINNYHYYRGGAETVFLEHNRMFEASGWRVMPFCMHHPKNLPTPWSDYFVEEMEFGSSYGAWDKLRRMPKVVYSFEARRKLRRLLSDASVDICHAHNVYHHISPSIFGLLHERGCPTVLTLHDLKVACPAYNMLAHDGVCERCKGGHLHNVVKYRCIKGSVALSTLIFTEAVVHKILGSYRKYVDRFIVPSRFYMEKLGEWGMPANKFRHVPNFVDTTRFAPRYAPGRSIIYVGRISREKGLHTLIRAAHAVDCPLRLAGTGPELNALQALAEQIGANVEFLGYLKGEALQKVVQDARGVVLASECYENAPMSILEGYALGKPAIGARIGGIPELIRHGETGLSFESGQVDSLAQALLTLFQMSDSQVEEMGRCGRQWVEQDFSAAVYRERILQVYRELGVRAA